jgi:hypothetical protein
MYEASLRNLYFRIESDSPEVGWYLYVFENEDCIYDYLQNTLEITKEFALQEFNVPITAWKKTS